MQPRHQAHVFKKFEQLLLFIIIIIITILAHNNQNKNFVFHIYKRLSHALVHLNIMSTQREWQGNGYYPYFIIDFFWRVVHYILLQFFKQYGKIQTKNKNNAESHHLQ